MPMSDVTVSFIWRLDVHDRANHALVCHPLLEAISLN